MNVNMWEHPATQENMEILRARGVHIVVPDEGYLACGMTGAGRLAGVESIARAASQMLGIRHDLAGETVLITAGPTCEDLDPVRYLTNRSSGKMGYALADAAARRGARVVLVSGPAALERLRGVKRMAVRSAEEMHRAVLANLSAATIVIMAAAVADYRAVAPQTNKIKRRRRANARTGSDPGHSGRRGAQQGGPRSGGICCGNRPRGGARPAKAGGEGRRSDRGERCHRRRRGV